MLIIIFGDRYINTCQSRGGNNSLKGENNTSHTLLQQAIKLIIIIIRLIIIIFALGVEQRDPVSSTPEAEMPAQSNRRTENAKLQDREDAELVTCINGI